MATSAILTKWAAEGTFTITLTSLANSTSGAGNQSTLLDNSTCYPAAIVSVRLRSNGSSAPTAGAIASIYLLRDIGTLATDNAGATATSINIENAPLLGTLVFTATTGKDFYSADLDTAPLGPLGPTWGIAVVNSSGQALNSSDGGAAYYRYYYPEAQ